MGMWHDEPYASKQMGQSKPFVFVLPPPLLGPSPIPAAAAIFPSAAAIIGGRPDNPFLRWMAGGF